jgi:4-carboxymuconolactone decarboxylase
VPGREIRNPKALAIIRDLFPATGFKRLEQIEALDPGFAQVLEDFVFGGMYARGILDQKTRELCALAGLVALGRKAQTRTHIMASLNAGASRKEVQEVILQMAVIAGFPATLEGIEVMQATFAHLDEQ